MKAPRSVERYLIDEGESAEDIDVANLNTPPVSAPVSETRKEEKTKPAATSPAQMPEKQTGERVFATPLAKRLAKEKNIDLGQVQGTGR